MEVGPRAEAAPRAAPLPSRPQQDHGVAARVNNEIITWKDVRDTLTGVKGEVTAELRAANLRKIAQERLFLQAAREIGLTVSEQELDDRIRRETKASGGEEEYERIIRLSGKTKTEWRDEKRRQLLEMKLHGHLIQKSFTAPDARTPGLMIEYVPPQEIQDFYAANAEQFKAIENVTFLRIALQYSTPAEEELKRALLGSLFRRLEEGTDFHFLAAFYSDVPRARNFEDRQVTRDQLKDFYQPETLKLLFETLKPGETSGIVKDRNTLNVFQLLQHVRQKQETLEEAQPRIRSYLENLRREENRRKLRAHLIQGAYLWPPNLFDED
jgi:hypothetical protein